MQPIAVFTAPTPGVLNINGRFAGEAGPDSPLIIPVTPNGTLYTEFSPFSRRYRTCAHKLRIVSGRFDPDSASDMCHMLLWPGDICEFSISPPAAYPPESEYGMLDGRAVAILRSEASMLRVGQSSVALPENAALPNKRIAISDIEIYLGTCPPSQYAAAYSASDLTPIGSISADTIEITENSHIRAVTALNDTSGHTLIEIFRPSPEGFTSISAEYSLAAGIKYHPDTPEATVLAAVEAAMLGLDGEAAGYLAPALRTSSSLTDYAANYDAVIPMKYAPPNAASAVALVKKLTVNAAEITPLYYRATHKPPYLIDSLYT